MGRETIPHELLQTLLNLADMMELAHKPLPIPVRGHLHVHRAEGVRPLNGYDGGITQKLVPYEGRPCCRDSLLRPPATHRHEPTGHNPYCLSPSSTYPCRLRSDGSRIWPSAAKHMRRLSIIAKCLSVMRHCFRQKERYAGRQDVIWVGPALPETGPQ